MFGAPDDVAQRLREVATAKLAPAPEPHRSGLLSKLGPIFKRPPGAPVTDPDDPLPEDLDRLLSGSYVPAERSVATWRLVELLIKETGWGSTDLSVSGPELDGLDFSLARGGVPSTGGLRHLLNASLQLPLLAPHGLMVGYQHGEQAMRMAAAYHQAVPDIESAEHRDQIEYVASWLDGFEHWTDQAAAIGRPAPDVVGFWGVS